MMERIYELNRAALIHTLPIYNSFEAESSLPWYRRHTVSWIFTITALIGIAVYAVPSCVWKGDLDQRLDRMAVTMVDFGDFTSLKKMYSKPLVEIDEVFGNQFVKEKDKVVDNSPEYVDPRIAGAVNPVIGNATAPVDLTPEVQPVYTPQARAAAIEGMIFLELVIAENGSVLRAKPVGKKLGLGLEESAAHCFKNKKFKPSMNRDGVPITVKIIQPVRFELI